MRLQEGKPITHLGGEGLGAYVIQEHVMEHANMVDAENFRTIARYLEEQGWIADAEADYGVCVATASGINEAIRYPV